MSSTLSTASNAQDTVGVDFSVLGLTFNQSTALNQINDACVSVNADQSAQVIGLVFLCTALNRLNPNNAEDLRELQSIAGAVAVEEAFAINDSLVTLADYQTTNVQGRLNALRDIQPRRGIPWQSLGENGYLPAVDSLTNMTGGAASGDLTSRWGTFVNGHVSSGEISGGELQQDADIASSSLTVGADYRFSNHVVAGIGLGVVQDETSFTQVSGGAQSDGFNVTAFASWYESDEGYLDIVLDVGHNEFELSRDIAIAPITSLAAQSSPSANTTSLTLGAGRNFRPFGWDLGGYFRLAHSRANVDAYAETVQEANAGFAATFSFAEQTVVSTEMVFGLELSKAISTRHAVLVPLLRVEHVIENERDKNPIEATLSLTGTTARYQGEDRASSYTNMGIGASAVFINNRSAYAFFETHVQHDLVSQDWLKVGLRWAF